MEKRVSRTPPPGAPEGTVWFGGPVDRFKITLRIIGDDVDPAYLTTALRCAPTRAETKRQAILTAGGEQRTARTGHWSFALEWREPGEEDVEDGIKSLLGRMPDDLELWATLTRKYSVDVFCGLFLAAENRGFGLSDEVCRMLADRHVAVSFDIYCP